MKMNKGWRPQPPKTPGYGQRNINPDKQRTSEQTIEALTNRMDNSDKFMGMKFLGSPTTNFASPFDAFYTRAGSLPSYLMTLPYFSMGPP